MFVGVEREEGEAYRYEGDVGSRRFTSYPGWVVWELMSDYSVVGGLFGKLIDGSVFLMVN